ncbi:site-specific integrase [Amycolatopsis sp. FU40]|uniref:tyrosine-type recombinase/integrase n=1 Tax=Amycolatopsis sp. FU40 TaxID=2914159 RepID=UPI001F3F426B|nr:site-specific integrase [Amycolatopsis sp. FU40]UKD57079.1 site-specific integrase [Amycolatopsis sp. FU40]
MTADAALAAANLVIDKLGVSAEQLLSGTMTSPCPAPTFADYIPRVARAVSPGARRTYQPYWNLLLQVRPDRPITEPTPTEFLHLSAHVKAEAQIRRNHRGGTSAAEHFIAAARCLYRHAELDRIITHPDNPAAHIPKPRRHPSLRRALTNTELHSINTAAAGGTDPQLDTLLLRLHTETACRRGGALALTEHSLDPDQHLVLLKEKGGTTRWQPVSPTLMHALLDHARHRPAGTPDTPLLRYRTGKPITRRRYDSLWNRIGRAEPWIARHGITTHWLRHTTLTWVERHFGYATAQAYAGHSTQTSPAHATSTATYVKATIHDVATALAALAGEPHPLAHDSNASAFPFEPKKSDWLAA